MKLQKLTLSNFKGIREFTLDAQGHDVDIFGKNATGKTSIYDAFLWLLFGKDSENKADFAIKTLDADGNELHGLEHAVEGVLEIGGKPLTLKKIYAEKWTKKKDAAQESFAGHKTDHFINGVPVKKNEYNARVGEIASEDIFSLLTSPAYFNEHLHWKDRRKALLKVCGGDISDSDVIAANKSLAKLPDVLHGRSLDDHRTIVQVRRSEIDKELKAIPVQIEEAGRAKPDISTIDNPAALPADIEILKEKIKKENEAFARLESGGAMAERTKRLREIEAEIVTLEIAVQRSMQDNLSTLRAQLNSAVAGVADIERKIERERLDILDRDTRLQGMIEETDRLRDKWREIADREFREPDGDGICPTCGQEIPEEQVEEARCKAVAAFNREQAELLESVNAEGKAVKVKKDTLAGELEAAKKAVSDLTRELECGKAAVEGYEKQIEALEGSGGSAKDKQAVAKLLKEKAVVEKDIEGLRDGDAEAKGKIVDAIRSFEADMAALEECKAKANLHGTLEKRISELEKQEKDLAAEYERLGGELHLSEQFIRQKVSMLDEKINTRFELARFKLFDVQINGAISECCETTCGGVPFGSLNNGARINVGLDIIRTLAGHYDFYPPIFIDNRESVTELVDMGKQQVVGLVVSGEDDDLRIEIKES